MKTPFTDSLDAFDVTFVVYTNRWVRFAPCRGGGVLPVMHTSAMLNELRMRVLLMKPNQTIMDVIHRHDEIFWRKGRGAFLEFLPWLCELSERHIHVVTLYVSTVASD